MLAVHASDTSSSLANSSPGIPSNAHAGAAIEGQPWSARLIVVEVADLADLASDEDSELPANIDFPRPVIRDPELAHAFMHMHTALETTTTRLERDEQVAGWLQAFIERFSTGNRRRSLRSPRDDKAFRRACDYLAERPEQNVSLDELATVAGIGKFRLVRLFRDRTGLPPHALQLACRVRAGSSKGVSRSPSPPPRPALPTRVTSIAISSAPSD